MSTELQKKKEKKNQNKTRLCRNTRKKMIVPCIYKFLRDRGTFMNSDKPSDRCDVKRQFNIQKALIFYITVCSWPGYDIYLNSEVHNEMILYCLYIN